MKHLSAAALLFLVFSCSTNGVEKPAEDRPANAEEPQASADYEKQIAPKAAAVEEKSYPNGLKIKWYEKGTGAMLEEGHAYEINYKVKLQNGEVVDGNHLLKRATLPFMVGYGMQTKGWDLAMKELKSGDFAEIYIPGNLARGPKGIPGLIPPNAPNIVYIRIGKEIRPTRMAGKNKVWVLEQKPGETDTIVGENSQVTIHYFVGTRSNPKYDNSWMRERPVTFGMKDNGIMPGLKKAMLGSKIYDKMWILIDPEDAYGSAGFLDRVKANEAVFYDLFVVGVE
jgi:FKBP-type peptidyl-prolyl cis-trans isomerase